MPIRAAAYAKSKTLYSLDLSSFELTSYDHEPERVSGTRITAVWTTSKKGSLQVCKGTLHHSVYREGAAPTLESFMATFDARYGGNPEVRWDGDYMWAPNTTLARMNELAKELDPILNNIPQVPTGYSGWYLIGGK